MYVYILGGRPKTYKYKTNKDSKYVDTGVLHIHEGGLFCFLFRVVIDIKYL